MIEFDKLVSVVVWYNPDDVAVENILAYSSECAKVFIVDNSDNDNSALAEKIPNAVYHPNFENKGIAFALNVGCENALSCGFEWCMTMDQDSSWQLDVLRTYMDLVSSNISEVNVSFAPQHINEIKSVVGDIRSIHKKIDNEILEKNKVMTSGNIINLHIWKKIGKFNESLFIDEVDHEFCYRLCDASFKILEFQNVIMCHTLGKVRRTILPRPCKHSGVRLYYIFRNMTYVKNNYPKYYDSNNYRKYILVAILQKFLEFKWNDIAYIKKGIADAKINKFGKFQ